jgi:hypothetical protein
VSVQAAALLAVGFSKAVAARQNPTLTGDYLFGGGGVSLFQMS